VENLTIEILKQIRDEIRSTREDLGGRIDQTNSRLDQTNSRLDKVEGTLLDLAEQQRFLVRHAKRSSAHEAAYGREIDELKRRVDDIETRLPTKGH
jgi:chromosome segregation ATPase